MAQQGFVYNVNEVNTIGSVLEEQAVKYGDKIYLYWKDEEVSYRGKKVISRFFQISIYAI